MRRFGSTDELTFADALDAPVRSIPRPSRLDAPLRLGPKARDAAAALGITAIGDVLEHLPHSHRDRRETRTVAALRVGESATVEVVVVGVALRRTRDRRRTRVEVSVRDDTGPLVAVWFNQPWIARQLPEGAALVVHGTLRRRQELWVSDFERVEGAGAGARTLGLVPVYPASERLAPERLRTLASEAFRLVRHTPEPLPAAVRTAERLPERAAALAAVHFPDHERDAREGRRRLAVEELLLFELALAARRRVHARAASAAPLAASGELTGPWLGELPFSPTDDQRAAFSEIDADLARDRPMQRLLMGEVGSGKTVVALFAMLRAVEAGHQAALMAPTETLAEQHLATLDRLLGGLVPIALLTGSTPAARRREIGDRLASGGLALVVGTHALIEPGVSFRRLALCVVDEQHRFGVRQRAALDEKAPEGLAPHVLHMTATPIPRTLALTAFGDLDTTTLRQLPAGRRPVQTHVVDGVRARARAYDRVREEIARGRQCFVVCSLVEESETLQARAARTEAERLAREEFPDLRLELIHGQMPSREKARAMAAFAGGEAQVLVATSVIEVGIDVPNASVMLIEGAERYGLSQLHQLRGRVGRGEHDAVCILFGDPGLPRLEAIAGERDGFRLAEIDLELRGAGEVLGVRQHGLPEFRVARLPEDGALLERARAIALALMVDDPELVRPEHALLREAALARFGSDRVPVPA